MRSATRVAEQLERRVQRRRVEAQRAAVVGALVERQIVGVAVRAPGAAVQAGRLRAPHLRAPPRSPASAASVPPAARWSRSSRRARRRPARLGHPAARPLLVARAGRHGVLQPGRQHRLVVEPVRDALEPAVEEAHALAERAHGGRRDAVHRIVVAPGPDQRRGAARRGARAGGRRRRCSRRSSRRSPSRDSGWPRSARRPSRAASSRPALMGEPLLDEMRRALEPLAPLRAPAVARDRRDRAAARSTRACSWPTGPCPSGSRARRGSGRRRRSDRRSRRC